MQPPRQIKAPEPIEQRSSILTTKKLILSGRMINYQRSLQHKANSPRNNNLLLGPLMLMNSYQGTQLSQQQTEQGLERQAS